MAEEKKREIVQAKNWKPANDGDSIEGMLLDKRSINSSKLYTIRTEEGDTQFWGSKVLDERLMLVNTETTIKITYKGKKNIAGGKTAHQWQVEKAA